MLDITIGDALAMLAVAALLAFVRLLRGPDAARSRRRPRSDRRPDRRADRRERCRHRRAGLPRRGHRHRADQFRRHGRVRAIRRKGGTTMTEWISGALFVAGATLALLAAVGVLRMPDVFTRMQASTKASTLGPRLPAGRARPSASGGIRRDPGRQHRRVHDADDGGRRSRDRTRRRTDRRAAVERHVDRRAPWRKYSIDTLERLTFRTASPLGLNSS